VSFVGGISSWRNTPWHPRQASNAPSETEAIHLPLLATNKTIRKVSP
jgi:hypothetical protein